MEDKKNKKNNVEEVNSSEEKVLTEEEKINLFIQMTNSKVSLTKICNTLNIKEYEALGLKKIAKDRGYNIVTNQTDKDIIFYNQGEIKDVEDKTIVFHTDENKNFKFIAIANTLLGNKAQQLSIIKDVYKQAKEMGIDTVFLCGNLIAGTYNMNDENYDSLFITDKEGQVEYFIENYPHEEGITTYFITGPKDNKGKISVGTRIEDARPDMVYLGAGTAEVKIDDALMKIMSSKPKKAYTTSYRSEKKVKALRSEDKPDILLYGCLNQADHIYLRESDTYTIPSLCATTKEMAAQDGANTVGALIFDVKIKEELKKKRKSRNYRDTKKTKRTELIKLTTIPYYKTDKNDYKNVNIIDKSKKIIMPNEINDDLGKERAKKYFNYIKDGKSIDEFKTKFHMNDSELYGIVELCNMYGLYVSFRTNEKNEMVFEKGLPKNLKIEKPYLKSDDIVVREFLVVSDNHLCNIHQQLGICHELYEEGHNRGVEIALNAGDVVDGNYTKRNEFPIQTFYKGFDDQTEYVIRNYPKFPDMVTKVISGNHDKTHDFNDGATVLKWVAKERKDIEYVGIDRADLDIDGIKIRLDHPADGSADALSYASQKSLERINAGSKPNIYITGHYHKWYEMLYNNVFAYSAPALCGQTNFEMTHKLRTMVGGFFLKVYINKKTGTIEYIETDPRIYEENEWIEEAGLELDEIIQKRRKLIKK